MASRISARRGAVERPVASAIRTSERLKNVRAARVPISVLNTSTGAKPSVVRKNCNAASKFSRDT